jgi:hypothetical protein
MESTCAVSSDFWQWGQLALMIPFQTLPSDSLIHVSGGRADPSIVPDKYG